MGATSFVGLMLPSMKTASVLALQRDVAVPNVVPHGRSLY